MAIIPFTLKPITDFVNRYVYTQPSQPTYRPAQYTYPERDYPGTTRIDRPGVLVSDGKGGTKIIYPKDKPTISQPEIPTEPIHLPSVSTGGGNYSSAFQDTSSPLNQFIQDPIDILVPQPEDLPQSRYDRPETYLPIDTDVGRGYTTDRIEQSFIGPVQQINTNLLSDTGLGFSAIDPSVNIRTTYIPGVDYAQQQMAQKTQSTQIPEEFKVKSDVTEPTLGEAYSAMGTRILSKTGPTVVGATGKALEFTGNILTGVSDIVITPESTATNEALKLTDPELQSQARGIFNEYEFYKASGGGTPADAYNLLGKIKRLVKEQEKIDRDKGTIQDRISDTQKQINEKIEAQNKLVEGNLDDEGYYIGSDVDKVVELNNEILSLEKKLEEQQSQVPKYTIKPESDWRLQVVGGGVKIIGGIATGTGQVLQDVAPYADITKIGDISQEQFFTGARTTLTAPGLIAIGATSKVADELGVVDLPTLQFGERTLLGGSKGRELDLGALDFTKISKGFKYDSGAMDILLPERNVVDKMLYEVGRQTPGLVKREVENIGILGSSIIKGEAPEDMQRASEGLVTAAFLAGPTFKLLRKGTQAAIEYRFAKDIGKMEGRVVDDNLVRFRTQFGRGGIARREGDVVVDQFIDTTKNTISSKTYQYIKKGRRGKVEKTLIDETKEKILTTADDSFLAELKQQMQTSPSKIKLDTLSKSETLVTEEGFSGAVKTRIRRKADIRVGQETKRAISKDTTFTPQETPYFQGQFGRKTLTATREIPGFSKLPTDITPSEANLILEGKLSKGAWNKNSLEMFLEESKSSIPGINSIQMKVADDISTISGGINIDSPIGKLMQRIKLQRDTFKEGNLYRRMSTAQIKTEQSLKLGKKTDIEEKWVKVFRNDAGEIIGVQTYRKPAPVVKETISKTAEVNIGGIIEDGRYSNIVTDLRTRSGSPMSFDYTPLEVTTGTIRRVGKGSGRWGKKGQKSVLQTSSADEVIDFIPDINTDNLQAGLLGPITKQVSPTARFALTEINIPSAELTNTILKNVNTGANLFEQQARITIPSFTNKVTQLTTMKKIQPEIITEEKVEQRVLQNRILQQQLMQQQVLQRQVIQQTQVLQQNQILQKELKQELQKRQRVKKSLLQTQISNLIPVRSQVSPPKILGKTKKPAKIKIKKQKIMLVDDFEFDPTPKKKMKKKLIQSSRYSASLSGLLSGTKKKPKVITGVEKRGSKVDYSKQIRKLTGL